MVKSEKSMAMSRNKKHEDRELAAKTAFETSSVEIQTPHTMIILLESKEDMVLLKALSVLDKYASRLEENAKTLYELGIVSKIIPLLTHEVLFIKRFATKILSELSFLASVAEMLNQEEFVLNMMQLLNDCDDLVVKEFSSSIVAELSTYTAGHAQLIGLNTNLINTLLKHLFNPDPDIEKNCLQIAKNLLKDGFEHELVSSQPAFSIKVFIDLLNSEYTAIQNLTLDILIVLTQQVKGNPVPKYFQDCGGVTKLLSIIKNFEWKDIHAKCLDVLGNIYNDPSIAQHFLKDGVLQLFNYMKFINDPVLKKKTVEIISKITQTSLGRRVLAESGHISEITKMILEPYSGITSAACAVISDLAQESEVLSEMVEMNTVTDLLTVLAEEARGWEDKTAAAGALHSILQRDVQSCHLLIDADKCDMLGKVLSQLSDSVPIQAAIHIANCVTAVAAVPDLRPRTVTRHLVSSLLHCFQELREDTTPLKVAACEALCSLLSEPKTRGLLHSLQALPVIWASVTKLPNNVQLLQAVATLIHLCVINDKAFTTTLLQLNVLNWLLTQRDLRHQCPAWQTALETLLDKFLPLKFAITGRLEFTDVTETGFYVTKTTLTREQLNNNKFPILNDLIVNKCCPTNTIYVANFGKNEPSIRGSSNSSRRRSSASDHAKSSLDNSIPSSRSSFGYDSKFLLSDIHLDQYIEKLKSTLKDNELQTESPVGNGVNDGETIRNKALITGKFVADQMSGKDQLETCTAHTLDLHINELKVELMNSIIPVGSLCVGLHLERAVLFKVLADCVGLPASLTRGYSGRAWVEVALPVLSPTPRPAYPAHVLQPTHIVDLMSSPGTLYPLGSYEANLYCGLN